MEAKNIFTKEEKYAIAKALVEVANADGEVSEGEALYMGQLMNVLGLTMEEVKESYSLPITECQKILSPMSGEKKVYLTVMLKEMADADGFIDENELNVIRGVFLAAGIKI